MPSSFHSTLDSNVDTRSAMILHRLENANIPVILAAPHGGPFRFGSQNLTARPLLPGVVTRGDLHTMELLILIDDYVRRRTSNERRPHIVAARFHRQYIDANRNARILSDVAYDPDCSNAKNLYDQYHNQIDNCVAHSMGSSPFSRTLLLDIHGMGPYNDYVVVGTLNGQTCATAGPESVSQPHMGFLWHLRGILGSSVLPLPGCKDFPQYSGGHTVQRHGGGRVDALQLEFGGFLRTSELRQQIAEAVGEAILRTIQPMRIFLQTLASVPSVQWRPIDIPLVESKLKKARFLTPADIISRLATINKVLESQGAKKFTKKTLRIMMAMYNLESISTAALNSNQSHSATTNSNSTCNNNSNINFKQKFNYNTSAQNKDRLKSCELPSPYFPAAAASQFKILPKEFLFFHHQKIFTPIPFNLLSVPLLQKKTEGNIPGNAEGNIPENAPIVAANTSNPIIDTDISDDNQISPWKNSNSDFPSHQFSIVRRIFIYDRNEYFNMLQSDERKDGGCKYNKQESGSSFASIPKNIPPISVSTINLNSEICTDHDHDYEDQECDSSTSSESESCTEQSSTFNMEEFLYGGQIFSSSLSGFIFKESNSTLESGSPELCTRTGDSRDTVNGYMVTFADISLFNLKLIQWQRQMDFQHKTNHRNRKICFAVIPLLATFSSSMNLSNKNDAISIKTGVDDISSKISICNNDLNLNIVELNGQKEKEEEKEKEMEKEKEKEKIFTAEEYLYTAYVCYQNKEEGDIFKETKNIY